jgi:hypothetical protein
MTNNGGTSDWRWIGKLKFKIKSLWSWKYTISQAFADWSLVLSTMAQQQRLTMLDLSSPTAGEYLGELLDLGLGYMLESYLAPVTEGCEQFYDQLFEVSATPTNCPGRSS